MDVISTGPLPVASLVWQPRPGAWVLTVVCKATYLLRQGECALAPTQEAPAEEDRYWNDDATRSLRTPRDLIPVKPGADVMLLGHVHAPEGRPARTVEARLSVGDLDKAIEAIADRSVRPDGAVREGAPFLEMPIVYERAGGGPGTANPVGRRRAARDAEGHMVLPNLQRPGASMANVFEPVGFGPIAPGWPERKDRLVGGASAGFPFRDFAQRPLPEGMDLAFFNAAPKDQQLRALGERLRIALENLHPDHPKLVATLPTTPPRAVLEGRRDGSHPITLRADTLLIDTDRGLCTLTFRGMVPLQGADERGRVVVSSDPERPAPEVAAAAAPPEEPAGVPPGRKFAMTADIPLEVRMGHRAALPFAGPPAPAPVAPAAPAPAPRAAEPAPLHVVEAPPVVAPAPAPVPASPWAARGGAADMPAIAPPAFVPHVAASSSVFDVSTAAAGEPRTPPRVEAAPARPAPEPEPDPEPAPRVRTEPVEPLELVWFDAASVPRFRRKAEWQSLLDALQKEPPDPDFDDPAFGNDPSVIEDRREVFEILAEGGATSAEGLEALLGRCVRAGGKFVPGLALFAGELELPFDELAVLRATVITVSPLIGPDESLKSAVQAGKDFLATPGLMTAPAVAEGLIKRIEDAFSQGKRVVPAGYLEAQRERALLEQRQYQRRSVLGAKHLRGLIKLAGAEPAGAGAAPPGVRLGGPAKPAASASPVVPSYLPEAIAEELPLYARFRVRMLAEVRMAADRYETHPAALRVLALARMAPPPNRERQGQ